mgnify:CR=1 FL=1
MLELVCYRLLDWYGREVSQMDLFLSLLVTIVASVISHLICKWLDCDK